jgi:hypothetical protein
VSSYTSLSFFIAHQTGQGQQTPMRRNPFSPLTLSEDAFMGFSPPLICDVDNPKHVDTEEQTGRGASFSLSEDPRISKENGLQI